MRLRSTLALVALLLVTVACSGERSADEGSSPPSTNPAAVEGGAYEPAIDPDDFVNVIDNPYMPLIPGTVLSYVGNADGELEREELVVTYDTKEILGITTTVVHDQVLVKGVLAEDTFDWFAQDRFGNVWYFGENSRDIEHDKVVSRSGSWEAGVDGAQPGIVMPADPQVGDLYRQEFYEGEAEDTAQILRLHESVTVPHGSFDDVLVTEDRNPLEPKIVENKYYARGVGVVQERLVEGGGGTLNLVAVHTMDPPRFASIEDAVALIQRRMNLPVVLPSKLPRGAHLSIYNLVEVSRFEGRTSAHMRLDFGVQGYLFINYGMTGFDGCGADSAEPVDVLGQRGLIVEHQGGGSTIIWPVLPGSTEGRYGLNSNTLPANRLIAMAESMERARAQALAEETSGC